MADPAPAPEPQQSRRRRLVRWGVVLLALLLLGWLLWRDADDLRQLRLVQPAWLLVDPVLICLNLWGVAKANQALLRALDTDLEDGEAFALLALSRLGNLLGPMRAGAAARGAYLLRRYQVPLTHFVALLGTLQLLLMTLAALAALAVTPLLVDQGVPSVPLLVAELTVVLGCLVLLVWQPRIPGTGGNFVVARIRLVLDGWRRIQRHRDLLVKATAFASLQLAATSTMFWCEFRAFGHELPAAGGLYIASAFTLESLLGLTPAGLGVREALVVLSASAVGAPDGVPVAVALVRRAAVLVTMLLLTPWALRRVDMRSTKS